MRLFRIYAFVCILVVLVITVGCVTHSPLMDAVEKGDFVAVSALLDKGADVNERQGTALILAAGNGYADMVELLIERGADLNAMTKDGLSPLGMAAESGHSTIVRILIAKGADIDEAIRGLKLRAAYVAEHQGIIIDIEHGINLIITEAGWVYSSIGQYQKAVDSFRRAISLSPSIASRSEIFAELSFCYYELRQYDNAITSARRAIELNPDNIRAYYNLGAAYARKGRYDEAEKAFKNLVELKPEEPLYHYAIGYFLFEGRYYERSVKYLKKAVDLEPNDENYLLLLVAAYSASGSYDAAIDALKGIIGYESGYQFEEGRAFRAWLGVNIESMTPEIAAALGVEDQRGALVTDVHEDGPAGKAGIRRGDVITAIGSRDVLDREGLADLVSSLKPGETVEVRISREGKQEILKVKMGKKEGSSSLAEPLSLRSIILRHKGQPDKSLKDAENAYSLDPDNKWARLAFGAARLDHNQYDEAIELLSQVKDSATARILEATAYAKKVDYQKAIDVYSSIDEELSPKNVPLWSDRKKLLVALKAYTDSKKQEAARLKAQGRYKEALKELGELMKIADDTELKALCREIAGIMAMDPSLSAIPEEARKYALRGDVLTEEGKFEEAVKEYRQAIEAAPYIAKLHFNTAMVYGELKKYSQAIRYMKTYLLLAPEAPNARAAKDQIYKWELMMEKGE